MWKWQIPQLCIPYVSSLVHQHTLYSSFVKIHMRVFHQITFVYLKSKLKKVMLKCLNIITLSLKLSFDNHAPYKGGEQASHYFDPLLISDTHNSNRLRTVQNVMFQDNVTEDRNRI